MNVAPPTDVEVALTGRRDLDWVHLVYVPEVGSTNDVATALAASGAPDGTTVLAAHQTGGRGRRGRVWHSPRDAGLYVSLLLRGPQSPLVTLLAGVAVAEAIRGGVGVEAQLKWPNDVVLPSPAGTAAGRPRKVAGILTERLPAVAGEGAVVGIGINVGRAAHPPELAPLAVSLEEAAGGPVERGGVLAELLAGVRRDGRTAGIGDDGALLVDCGGRTERIVGGEVRWA